MIWSLDARLPVYLAPLSEAPSLAAFLVEGDAAVPSGHAVERFVPRAGEHPAGCTCCGPRSPAAQALSRLFIARARGTAPHFAAVTVIAGAAGEREVQDALRQDPAVAAWFRLAGPEATSSPGQSSPGRTPETGS